jgi:hypothetical protein
MIWCKVPKNHPNNYDKEHNTIHNKLLPLELALSRGGLHTLVALNVSICKKPSLNVDSPCEIPGKTVFILCSQEPAQHPYDRKWKQHKCEFISSTSIKWVGHYKGAETNYAGSTIVDYAVNCRWIVRHILIY